jgi:hypothetical protein
MHNSPNDIGSTVRNWDLNHHSIYFKPFFQSVQCRSLHLFKFLQALFARKIQADPNPEQRKIGTRKEIAIRDPELEVTTMSSGNDSEQKSVDQSTQVYEGNCHCKAVLFSAILPTKLAAVSCNCEYLQEPYLPRFHTPRFCVSNLSFNWRLPG